MSRRSLVMLALAGALVVSATVGDARAEPGADDAAAEALFDEGVSLRKAGDRAGACAKFRRSYRLSPARGTLLNIAECYEAEGKLASAWATYSTLGDKAEAADDRERLRIARDKRAELAPRLAYLSVAIANPPAGVEVRRDDTSLPSEVLDEPAPIDAGMHTITVSAPGYHAWTTKLDVTDGTRHRLEVPALEPLPPPPPPAAPSTLSAAGVRTETLRRRHPRSTAGIITTSAGALGITMGLGFGVGAWRAERDAFANCDDGLACNQAGVDHLERAHSHARTADYLVGAGLVVTAVGVALWWTSPDTREITVTPVGGPGMVGVAVGGSR